LRRDRRHELNGHQIDAPHPWIVGILAEARCTARIGALASGMEELSPHVDVVAETTA
jgi:hypothetical protein